MYTSQTAILAALGTVATTATAQPDAWKLLDDITVEEIVTETSYEVKKNFPAGFDDNINGFEITGYAVPYAYGVESRDIILVSDIGFCPFCGDPDHGVSLQISLADPIELEDDTTRLRLKGTLKRVTDPETWQSAILQDAIILTE